ncbi:hypothetical protein [Thermococcus sp.]|uniref:hypothetical protein n=1 Tax=Thermococcus sp. TaxID=35749 RepID=UPI0026023939|nr:hypothetical protein [Thermococcus sp.]
MEAMKEALEEVERRIKKIEAEIELLEEGLERAESEKKPPKVETTSVYYLAFMAFWAIAGLILLAYMRSRVAPGVRVPIGLYALIALVIFVPPFLYLLMRKPEEEPAVERISALRLTLSGFYRPLKKALEENDREALTKIADRLLDDPRLASAVELANEGDAKLNAYALYLYARYSPELKGEVEETLERLTNKPLRALLSSVLRE